jgi:hypothetical protein
MTNHPRPRGICPVCGREIAGRFVKGELILRAHKRAAAGTRQSGWGPSIDCAGAGGVAERRTDMPAESGAAGDPENTEADDDHHRD